MFIGTVIKRGTYMIQINLKTEAGRAYLLKTFQLIAVQDTYLFFLSINSFQLDLLVDTGFSVFKTYFDNVIKVSRINLFLHANLSCK